MTDFYAEVNFCRPRLGPTKQINLLVQAPDYEAAVRRLLDLDLGIQLGAETKSWIDLYSLSKKPTRGRNYISMSLPVILSFINPD